MAPPPGQHWERVSYGISIAQEKSEIQNLKSTFWWPYCFWTITESKNRNVNYLKLGTICVGFPLLLLPITTKLSGWKQHKCIILWLWRLEVQKGSHWLISGCHQGCISSGSPLRRNLPASGGCPQSLDSWPPSCIFKAGNSGLYPSHGVSLWLLLPLLLWKDTCGYSGLAQGTQGNLAFFAPAD